MEKILLNIEYDFLDNSKEQGECKCVCGGGEGSNFRPCWLVRDGCVVGTVSYEQGW